MPPGLSLSSAGVLAGLPLASGTSGTYSFTVRASDPNSCFGTAAYTMATLTSVPSMPQLVLAFLGAGLLWLGYARLRQRIST